MMKYIIKALRSVLLLGLFFTSFIVSAQTTILQGEYFIDSDPGVGKATALTLDETGNSISSSHSISTQGLSEGFHHLHIRVRNANGVWSTIKSRVFYVIPTENVSASPNLDIAEYFIDTDPGIGKGTSLTLEEVGSSLSSLNTISTEGLSEGFHDLHLRVRNTRGVWSTTKSRAFYVLPSLDTAPAAAIVNAEYFVDSDPGIGKGTAFDVTEGGTLTLASTISAEGLSEGFHNLHVRVQNANGAWSTTKSRAFYVLSSSEASPSFEIAKAEYFFGDDPGLGKGTPLDIEQSGEVTFTTSVDISELSEGFNHMHLRVQSDLGVWSTIKSRLFYITEKSETQEQHLISYMEYFIDTDPGRGSATEIAMDAPLDAVQEKLSLDISSLENGEHHLYLRVRDEGGVWSHTVSQKFDKTDLLNQVITFEEIGSKIYGDESFAVTVSVDSENAVMLSSSDESIATIDEENNISIHGAGEVTITASAEGNDTYVPALIVEQKLNIAKADLTVSVPSQGVEYGEEVASTSLSYEGFVNDDNENDLDEIPTISTEATSTSGVGSYAVALSEVEDNHYNVITEDGTVEIVPAPLTVTASSESIVYGEVIPTFTIAYTGFKNTETVSDLSVDPSITTTIEEGTNVGTYAIALGNGEASNYTFNYVEGSLEVNPATLMVNLSDASKVYGEDLPETTYTYSGFVNDEDESVVTTAPVVTSEATALSAVGTYEITGSGAEATNYTFEYGTASMEVTPASLFLSAENASKLYGAVLPSFTITGEGFVGEDDMSSLSAAASVTTTATSSSNVGDYALTVYGGAADNYTISYGEGTLSVTAAEVSVTVANSEKVYGSELPTFTYTVDGLVNDDETLGEDFEVTYSTEANRLSNVGTYEVSASGSEVSNYTVSYNNGEVVVTPATLMVNVSDVSKVYGADLPEATYTYSGFVNNEDESVITMTPVVSSEVSSASPVGIYEVTASGAEAMNYTFEYEPSTLEVTPAEAIISVVNSEKVFGDELPDFTYSVEGLVNNDVNLGSDFEVTYSTEATAISDIGNYNVSVTGSPVNNYTLTYKEGVLSITPATVTVTVANAEKVYGEDLPTFTYSIEGLDNADEILGGSIEFVTEATSESDAGEYTISVNTSTSANYSVSVINGILSVLKADQIIENFIEEQTIQLSESSLTFEAIATSGLDVMYTSSDESIISIDGIIANLLANGEVWITASQEGNQNYNEAPSITALLTVESDVTTALEDEIVSVNVYPNPASHYFVLEEMISSIQLYDTQGRLMKVFTETLPQYDISSLPSGTYALMISTKSGAKKYSKLIVK